MTDQARRRPPAAPEMFSNLIASRPQSEAKAAAAATLTSVVFHAILVAGMVWATLAMGKHAADDEDEQVTLIKIEEEPPAPPPPPPPPPDAPPPTPQEVVDAPKGFQTLAPPEVIPPDIPPPSSGVEISEADFSGEGVEGGRATGRVVTAEDIEKAPVFTPHTVAPELKNRDEVQRALVRFYPPLLRDAGIGGRVMMWFFIDEQGRVVKTQLIKTSGHASLDEAAGRVANLMQFTPALNRDQRVRVWVQIPIDFRAK